MKQIPSHLVKVHDHVYLSRNDHRFLEKYLKYFPYDPSKHYEYAEQLEREGLINKAMDHYTRAAEFGHPLARRKVRQFNLLKTEADEKYAQVLQKERRARGLFTFALLLLLLSLLFVAVLGFDYVREVFHFHQIEEHFYQKDIIHHPIEMIHQTATEAFLPFTERALADNGAIAIDFANLKSSGLSDEEILMMIKVQNGIERYVQHKGKLPSNLNALTGQPMENWLSGIPGGVTYSIIGHKSENEGERGAVERGADKFVNENLFASYSLMMNDTNFPLSSFLLELHFYPKTNQLALAWGEDILSLYTVASGIEPLPFSESKVSQRVVNPNGGETSYGTRGLVLQDQYAIHGTDQPIMVGMSVSQGCLRMVNEDIESLYPYVALGTPFKVIDKEPREPIFIEGLPQFALGASEGLEASGASEVNSLIDWTKEETPGIFYAWRN